MREGSFEGTHAWLPGAANGRGFMVERNHQARPGLWAGYWGRIAPCAQQFGVDAYSSGLRLSIRPASRAWRAAPWRSQPLRRISMVPLVGATCWNVFFKARTLPP